MAELIRCFSEDPGLCDGIFDLLGRWIPALPEMRRAAERLGDWRWEDLSTPFALVEDGRVISHVGVLDVPLVVCGREQAYAGIHAVCTLESRRRQGLYRRVMEEVLDWCDKRYETLELTTENPEYYEPFGFRVVPEHTFVARPAGPSGSGDLRPLRLDVDADVALLNRLLAGRVPVSSVLGSREQAIFKFNYALPGGLSYSPSLDAVLVLERQGARVTLDDLVVREVPTLDRLLAAIGSPLDEIELRFSPDLLDADAKPVPTDWNDYFMVRGPFAAEGLPLVVPPGLRH